MLQVSYTASKKSQSPSEQKFLSYTMPSCKSLELSASKDSNITYRNQHLQGRSMSLSRSQGRRTRVTPDEFDLMRLSAVEQHEHEHDNRPQRSLSKTEVIIKDGPKGSGKGKGDDDGFKCSAFCMCLPVFGNKAKKPVKARKRETKLDHHHPVDPMMMSSTFSVEIIERNSGVITNENNKEDESISSYFELPLSQMFKHNGDAAQSPLNAAFVLDNKDNKGEHL